MSSRPNLKIEKKKKLIEEQWPAKWEMKPWREWTSFLISRSASNFYLPLTRISSNDWKAAKWDQRLVAGEWFPDVLVWNESDLECSKCIMFPSHGTVHLQTAFPPGENGFHFESFIRTVEPLWKLGDFIYHNHSNVLFRWIV